MKKFFVVMMCLIMTVCFMPTVAMAEGLPTEHPYDNSEQCTNCVASVISAEGETKYYDSLATAIEAAANGDTVKLLGELTVNSLVTVSDNITLDLGNYTLTAGNDTMSGNNGKGFVIQTTGDVIIQNGYVKSTVCRGISASAGTLNLKNVKINTFKRGLFVDNAVVTVDKDCKITTSGPDSPVVIWGTGDYHTDDTYQHATLHFYGSADATNASGSDYAAITGNGSDNSYTYIYIYSGATLTSRGHALYAPQAGEVTIKGGTLKGGGAVGVKSGKLTITGGTLKGTGAYIESPKSSGNGIDGDGSAINIDSNGGYAGNMEISISGTAKLNSTNGHAIREIGAEDDTTSVVSLNITKGTFTAATGKDAVLVRDITKDKTTITGGKYSSNPVTYVPETYEVLNGAPGTYVVKPLNNAVACIGDKKFDTLSNAITAAQANDTVMLLNDATASNIYIKKSITLDLSGFSVKKSSIVRSGLFKINDDGVTFSIINSNTTKVSSLNGNTYSGQYTIATLKGTNDAKIIIGKNVAVKGNTVVLLGNNPTLDVYGTIDTEGTLNPPIMTNGSTTTNSVIKINEGAEIKTSQEAAIYHPDGGTITVSGGTITGAHGIQMCSGKLIINGSPEITATGKKNISAAGNDGTIPDGAAISVINRSYPGGVPSVTISGTPAIKSLDGENALWAYNWNSSNKTAEEWDDGKKNVSISGGYFTSDPTVYLASGKALVTSDKVGFAYKVGDPVSVGGAEVSPAPDTTPKADVENIASDDKDAVKTAIESTSSTGLNAAAAAVAENPNKVTEDHVASGVNKVKNELNYSAASASNIKLVVQPYLDITAQSYTTTAEGNKELAVEITPKYNLLATKSDTDITTLNTTGTGETKNAVVIAENKDLPVDQNTQVTITFQLPSGFITDGQMDKLFVVHTKKDGSKETYKANVTKSGDNYIATFTTNGFSPFVFMVDSRTATVTFDGTSKTYVASNVGEALPTSTAPSGKVFGGWTFEGISGTYTTLTEDLLTALNGRTVTATPYFYTPNYGGGGIVTTPLDKAKSEASKAVSEYVKESDYEAAEQAEIKSITEKAIADIKNAKTEAEVKTIEAAAKAELDKLETAEEMVLIRTIEATKFKARSKATTLNGKKAIRVTWNVPEGIDFDGFEIYRSTEKYKGFGTKPIFTSKTQKYTNNKGLKVGKTYYYKVRAFKYVNDEKVYTEYSYKAIRTVK